MIQLGMPESSVVLSITVFMDDSANVQRQLVSVCCSSSSTIRRKLLPLESQSLRDLLPNNKCLKSFVGGHFYVLANLCWQCKTDLSQLVLKGKCSELRCQICLLTLQPYFALMAAYHKVWGRWQGGIQGGKDGRTSGANQRQWLNNPWTQAWIQNANTKLQNHYQNN